MMEIKGYKSTLIASHLISFQLGGRLVQGQVFSRPICRGPIWQRAELSSSHSALLPKLLDDLQPYHYVH